MAKQAIIDIKNINLYYDKGQNHALKDISMAISKNEVTALIGPSGCGKSSLIRCLNQMNNLIEGVEIKGSIVFDQKYQLVESQKKMFHFFKNKNAISPLELRTRVGMVFQKPNPFPMSIYDNVAYGPKAKGIKNRKQLDSIVQNALQDAALWGEVKAKLNESALSLSGGQQQRLCIARAVAMAPEVLLMDEPTSSLDPIATFKIEKLITKLKAKYTIVIVTHSMQQATRISDNTAFLYLGKLVEYNKTKLIFTNPQEQLTNDYISGRMG